MRPRAALLLMLVLAAPAFAELRVFEIAHGPAEDVLPVVKPLLGPYESVSVYRNSLVVNAGPDALERIGALLGELDRPLANLRISLRRAGEGRLEEGGAVVRGGVQAGDVRISTDPVPGSGTGAEVRIGRSVTTTAREGGQQLSALEGTPVLIREGELVPLARGGAWGPQLDWQPLERGFRVTARLQGEDGVRLTVDARDDRVENGQVRTADLGTELSGRLGDWIPLGGSSTASSRQDNGTVGRWSTRETAGASWEIRVERLP